MSVLLSVKVWLLVTAVVQDDEAVVPLLLSRMLAVLLMGVPLASGLATLTTSVTLPLAPGF